MRDDLSRLFGAAIIAPLSLCITAPLGVLILDWMNGSWPELPNSLTQILIDLWSAIFLIGVTLLIAYVHMLLGVPAYLVLRKLNLASIWTVSVAGFLIGGLFFSWPLCQDLVSIRERIPEFERAYLTIRIPMEFRLALVFGALGASVAAIFWLLLHRGPRWIGDLSN